MQSTERRYSDFKLNHPLFTKGLRYTTKGIKYGVLGATMYGKGPVGILLSGCTSELYNELTSYLSESYGNETRQKIANWIQKVDPDTNNQTALYGADKFMSLGKLGVEMLVHKGIGKFTKKYVDSKSFSSKYWSKTAKIPKNVINNTENFIKDAIKHDRNSLSKVGRGLQKHSSRKGPFNNIKFSHKNANEVGEKVKY